MSKKEIISIIVISGTVLALIVIGMLKLLNLHSETEKQTETEVMRSVMKEELKTFASETGICFDLAE